MRPHLPVIAVCSLVAACPSTGEGTPKPAVAPPSSAGAPVLAAVDGAVASTSAVPTPSGTGGASQATSSTCEALFAAPEGADPLCDEHVLGNGAEIHWRSFATREPRLELNRRYLERSRGCGLGIVTTPPSFDLRDGDRRHFETYAAGERGYPQCASKPTVAHQTVIVISEITRR